MCEGSEKKDTLLWNYSNLYQNFPHQYNNHHGYHGPSHHHTPGDQWPHTYQYKETYRHPPIHHRDDQVANETHKTVQTNQDGFLTVKNKRSLNKSSEKEIISSQDNAGVLAQNSKDLTELEELGT